MFPKLQYISQGSTAAEQLSNIREALQAGCTWIQLRYKQAAEEELLELAEKVKAACASYNAIFIVNDHPGIARAAGAHGVHLGLQDMPVAEARSITGPGKIIGGTANTFEDMVQRYREGCDYAGLGPFRFTTTKKKLSPVLGAAGYRAITRQMEALGIDLPVYAIGGILPEDLPAILDAGVYGIALSGAITHHPGKKQIIQQLHSLLYANAYNS